MNILAIDPGITTGYAWGWYNEDQKMVNYYPHQTVDAVDDLWRKLRNLKPRYIIIEDFEFRSGAARRGGLELFSVQLIGVANLYALIADHDCAIFVQKAAVGKGYYTDTLLKKHDLYKRGIPHAMDASRHLLQWLTFGAGYKLVEGKHVNEFAQMLIDPPTA